MKRLSSVEYKRQKLLKQQIKAVQEKETDEPLIESTVKMRAYRGYYGGDFFLPAMMFMMAIKMRSRGNPWKV